MERGLIMALAVSMLAGCGNRSVRMEHPEDPQGRYRDQIEAASRALAQNEDWADRAEWEVAPSGDGWKVTAWRVERPEAKGPDRYLPWGYSVIELDSRKVAIHYLPKK